MAALVLCCSIWALSSCSEAASLAAVCRLSCPAACRILVPPPGIKPVSSALEGELLATGPSRKLLAYVLNIALRERFCSSIMWDKDTKILGGSTTFLGSYIQWDSVQFSSIQSLSRVRLCNPMNCSMPGLLVHHQLPESTQTHVHQVSDAIQPSHPLLSPSPPALNLSQHQGLFQ